MFIAGLGVAAPPQRYTQRECWDALQKSDVRHSTAVLREFGNLSSPTVFFVLERALHDTVPDGLWWMSAFGAGFSCHDALLEVKET